MSNEMMHVTPLGKYKALNKKGKFLLLLLSPFLEIKKKYYLNPELNDHYITIHKTYWDTAVL